MNNDNSRGGSVEVECFGCGKKFFRYRSAVLKRVLCPNCRNIPIDKRLAAKLDKSGGANACWPFMGARLLDGYGSFAALGEWRAHRVAWVIEHGKIPKGKYVLHKRHCNNPACCNPKHLYLGDQTDNMSDMIALGRKVIVRGSDHYNHALNDEAVREIRRDYRRFAVKGLAEKFGVSIATIRDVARRRSWRHVI